ncbi:hypothetical protein STXM2123_3460 [Streptomyces sp. F-3]|nr:hypothetical protein STXM2123_3460 [Streptomyces sp. F-3]
MAGGSSLMFRPGGRCPGRGSRVTRTAVPGAALRHDTE